MTIKFIYPKDYVRTDNTVNRECLCEKVCTELRNNLTLPEQIQIEFVLLPPNAYADTYTHYKNGHSIRINDSLLTNDIIIPLAHELIHLEQLTLGKLMITHTGVYVWEKKSYSVDVNKMNYSDYLQLPWELDVHNRLPKILKELLF